MTVPIPTEQAHSFARLIAAHLNLDPTQIEAGSLLVEWTALDEPLVTWRGRATLTLDELGRLFAQAATDAGNPDGSLVIAPTCDHSGGRTLAGICQDCGAQVP